MKDSPDFGGCRHLTYPAAERSYAVTRQIAPPTLSSIWSDQACDAGFEHDAAYLVRPDGYVSAALLDQSATALSSFIDRFGIWFSA